MVSPEASLWLTHGYLLPVSSHSLSSGCVYTSVCLYIQISSSSLVAQMVKNLPAMQETQVQSLGREDLLEKEMATRSSILAGKIPWMEEPGRLQSMGSQRVGHD